MEDTIEHQSAKTSIKGSSKAVLVTGGAGYVGSHTCKMLAKNGYVPVTVDRHHREGLVSFGPSYVMSLPQEVNRLDEIITRYNITSCIHFAGSTSVPESVADPSLYYKNNLIVTISLLDKLIECGVKTFIYSSSAATYGDPGFRKCRETDVCNPINSYGATKLMMEQVCRDYKTAYGLSSVGLRYFNAAGADPEGLNGYTQEPATHVMPIIIDKITKDEVFTICGDDYDTKDGTCIRDYCHIQDIADAKLKAVEHLSNGGASGIVNLGSGTGFSIHDLINSAQNVVGKQLKYEVGPRRAGDPSYLCGDVTKAKNLIDWKPTYSLDDMFEHSKFWVDNKNKVIKNK